MRTLIAKCRASAILPEPPIHADFHCPHCGFNLHHAAVSHLARYILAANATFVRLVIRWWWLTCVVSLIAGAALGAWLALHEKA